MSLNDKLFSIASSAVEKQRKTRDSRSAVSKGFDVATNKSYANEDKKVAAKALREWENNTWKPKVEAKLKQELKARAPHLKPGSPKYNQTYESLFNKNYKDLQAAKAEAQQKIGTLRKPKQTQRELDNEYRTNESIRNNTVGAQAASHAARDTVSAVGGALATGTSRLLRAPLQLAADVGENDDGGIFDRGAKALESYEDNISNNVYQAYGDIQQNGNFSQKLAVSAVEQVPALAASFGAAGVAAKGVQAVGAGAKATAAASYGVAGASMYPQAYLDGSDSTKDELENATSEQLASAERSQDIYKGMFDKNVKAGMSEDEAHAKARDQTISEIAEESGENVGLATLALSMMAPGVGSFTANRAAGGAVSQWGQKVFNKLAVRADAGKVAGAAIPTAVGAGIVGLNVAEEGAQEGYTDYVAQKAAVDVGVKDKIDTAQNTEAVLMGGVLGGLMGGATYVGTRNSKLKQAQDGLKAAQQSYADIASTIPQLQEQITAVSPRSAEGQALTVQLQENKAALDAMASEAERRGIPRTSLARRAPRIEPTNSTDQEFDGQVDGATELDEQGFEDALNPQGAPAAQAQPVVDSQPSEQELDAQDAQIAELIAEQQALDEAIDDDSAGKPVEESLAAAQAWYDDKRGENKQGLSGVVSRAAAKVEDTAFAEQQQAIAGTGATINEYIAAQRAKQQQIDAEIEQATADAKTERERQAAEQLKQQRDIERAEAEAEIAKRAELAQPYENESFDTTVVGADGTPFNLARFWDSNMPAAIKAKAIADAFGGQIEQNVAKADWASLPEGVQKQLHQWMTGQLNAVRQAREGGDTQAQPISEPPLAPQSQQSVAPTANGLTMPAQQAPSATTKRRTPSAGTVAQQEESLKKINEELENYTPAAPVETDTATQLTDENPTINIPAPTQAKVDVAPTTNEGIYKSKPAAKAAIKKQKLDPNSVTINQVKGGGFEIVANAPAKPSYAQAQEQAATDLGMTLDENGEYGGTDAEFEVFANRVDEIQGRSLNNSTPTPVAKTETAPNNDVAIGKDGNAKWFGKQDKAQAFIDKKGISDTHEVVSAGKSRFEIQPKQSIKSDSPQADVAQSETVPASPVKPPQSSVVKAETASESTKSSGQSVRDIATSYASKDERLALLGEKEIHVRNAAKAAGRLIQPNSDWYKKAFDDASKRGSLIDGMSYGNRKSDSVSAYSIAAGEVAGAIRFVLNDDIATRQARDNSIQDANNKISESIQSQQKKSDDRKEKYKSDEANVLDTFGMSLDDVYNLVMLPSKKLINKAKRTKNKDDQAAADKADRKAKQIMWDVEDAVIAYANNDMTLRDFLDSKAGQYPALVNAVNDDRFAQVEAYNQSQKPKNITDEQFAELTSSRTTPSTPTGEQSAPAKRAEAKKAATEKTQNDVSAQDAKPKRKTAAELRASLLDKNKVVTKEAAAEYRATLKSSLGNLNSGFDPKASFAAMGLAAAYIEGGIRNFTDFATLLIDDAGVKVKSYLLPAWEAARNFDELDTTGMDSVEDSRKQFNELVESGFFDDVQAETEQASEPTTPAKPKHPESIDVGNDKRLFVGENTEGEPIYEDKNGIRSKPEGNFMASEPVGINLGGEGPAYDVSRRADKFKTVEEISENTNDDTEAGTQDQAGAPEVRARGSDPQSGATPADSGDVATEQPTNDSATDEVASAGRPSVRGAGANVADEGSVPSQRNAEIGREGTGDTRTSNARAGKRATDSGATSPAATKASATDLLIENPLEIVGGTPVQRFNKNREALELLQRLETESRQASPAEQKILAGYIGWGSFGQELFQGSWDHPKYKDEGVWKDRGEWLRETMGESAWKSAQRSITNAHYTDPPTVMAMWSMVERMGFTGGRVLEPSMGTGNFFSMMPAHVQSRSQLTGIELDEMTGSIAKQLFPQSNIQVMGYQESKTPDNFYDVVIGNYPFENTPVADRRYNKLNPMLHDYFFLKSMDQVRPGGLVISITSSGTMDKQNEGIRRELAKQADLVAAIRLPSGAFKDYAGTAVVTDIVILRKRAEKAAIVPEDATWVAVNDYVTPSGETIKLSQYYIDNPQNIIGTIDFGSGTTKFGAGMIVRRPDNMEERLQQAIDLVPENVMQADTTTDHLTYYANATGERHGSLFTNDAGELMLARGDQMVKAQDVTSYEVKSKATTLDRETQIKDAIDLRQKFTALVDKERAGQEAETERKALKSAYDAFTKNHGSLRDSYALKYMDRVNDPFYYDLAALEQDDGKPATIMSRSTTRGKAAIKNPSVRDAYVLARNKSVNPTLKEIAELTDKSEQEIRKELKDSGAVFEGPNGDIVPSDIYLSGNVRQKLREAEAALKDGNKAMKDNVASLKAVVPEDVPYFNIETKLGATWIPPEAYQDYIAHMLGKSDADNINVSFLSGRWKVKLGKGMNHAAEARTNYGTHHYHFSALVQAAFSNQVVRITRKIDGEEVYDHEATSEANERIAKIRGDFSEWLWSDPERRTDLEKEYNEARNAWATPKYDGSFLTFEGMALSLGKGEFNLREHQANAIWRAIVNRRSINAHEVGTGKTFTMGGIAIESRRYGIAKKPIIFAHNANSAAVAEEIRMMYPSARVLYVNNLEPKFRDIRLRQIANDDWDVIVMPHSLLDRMTLTEDTLMAMAADDIASLEQEFREAAEEDGENVSKINLDDDESIGKIRSTTAKELAKSRKRIIETIKKQAQQSSKANAVTFEDLGIDMILVDEVHEFKKPPIVTRMKMKGLNTSTSQRSIQMQFLTRYVRQMNNGGNVHTFTGTPITNTITEIYHQMRYVMETEMNEAAVSDWDGWFGSFATETQDVELSSAGDYEMVTRLAGFVNVPELRQMIGQYMDTVFAEDMPEMQPRKTESGKIMSDNLTDLERAELLNGRTEGAKDRPYKKVINESADMTAEQKRIFAQVQEYAAEWRDADGKTRRKWMKDGDHRSPLIYGRLADTASFDARLLDPDLVGKEGQVPDDENSKTSRVIKNVKDIYDSHELASQVIFMDQGYGTKATRSGGRNAQGEKNPSITVDIFSPVLDLVERLVQSGIPREQIAVVSGKTKKEERSRIAAAMNSGEIRVVIGSTQTLGVGVNMQRNLRAMHHMDAPYMPGELEQRNGRGQRQGNQWNTVLEYRYMTDRLDGKRWQILAVKQRFITAFMKAKGSARTIEGDAVEEESDILESFSEAAGDPRILQRVKLQKKQDQLNSKERLYTRGIADMRREIRTQTELAVNNQAALDAINPQAVEDALASQRDNFNVTIDGKTYDKRADATAALDEYIKKNVRLGDPLTKIGSYAGTPMSIVFKHGAPNPELVLTMGGQTFSGKGITGLESVMRNLPKQIEKKQAGIEKSKATVNHLKKAVTQPFTQKAELERVGNQIKALEADLDLNPIPAPVWLRQGAPMDSEVFYGKQPFVVTGHQYSKDGYFVVAEDDKGSTTIPYLEAKDSVGMPLYDEQEFIAPEIVTKKDADSLTEEDRVPGTEEPKYSKTNPAKGLTGTTSQQVISLLQDRFGKDVVASLIKAGKLRVRALNDFVDNNGRLLIPSDAEGFYYQGKVVLIADNLTTDTAVATLLHELGGHAGIQGMLSTQTYMGLMENFYDLVKSGNKYAVRAKQRAEASTYSASEARDEYIPYLITEYAQATERGGPLAVIKRFVNRVMAGVRAWVRANTGVQLKLTPNDITQLAERMVKRLAEQSIDNVTIAGMDNTAAMPQYSQENDIRFSRRYSNLGVDTNPTTAKEKAIDAAKQAGATALSSKFNLSLLLRRHLATPLHVGMLNPSFKTFFENVQARIAYENNEAGRVQEYMPEIWDTRLMIGKRREAIDKVSRALFDGTMADQVWTDPELEAKFNLDDKQKDMYRRARAAIDSSVLHMTVDTLSSLAKGTKLVNIHTINRLKLAGLTPIGHNLMIQQHMTDELKKLAQSGSITPAAEKRLQNQLDGVFDVMDSIAVKYDDLVEKGYAPLMRFGHYAVEVRDKSNNELDLFELYETKGQQRKAIKELKEKYNENDFEVGTGTLNPDAFKQFTGKGLSPETVQLFAAELGLDDDGAYQAYLKVAISNQSALKRLIHRKKVPGYSEDLPRVLSSFVMSNARYSGRALYNGEIENAIQKIEDGNLQGEAQNVFANMENPQEEFAGVRGLLFHYYMGFSTAFMVLNFTQPFTQTIPKLTAYVGAARAHIDMTQALGIITKYTGKATFEFGKKVTGNATPSWKGFEDHLPAWVKKEDYLRMTREGHLDPQNIWMIRGLERGKAGVISGLWGNLSRAAGWAAEVSETINRRGTMIAAFKVAQTMGDAKLKAEGFNSRYDFAVSVIQQTQGVYNKGNRSGLARGTGKLGQFGPLVMVFKQFSINYAEQMIRHGRDKEVKSIAVAMTWQFLLAGALGLPFTDDLRDIVEGLLYRLFGRATNLTAFLQDELGKDNADALMYGLLSEKTRFDMYGRSNMGNFIPGTDFARPKEGDWAEVIGASSGFFENFFTAGDMITKGQYKDAAVIAAPRYVRDAAAGIEIWNNGAYRNQKGDKVMDMDRTDAVIKGALQFNPASNAKQGRERSEKYHMKNMVLDKQNQFALQLTEALYQEDYDRVDELYNDMDAWNERNPEHFNVDIDKIEDSAERRLDKKDFTSEDRQKLPEQLDDYFTERE
ncbi:hypothetical protein BTW00_02325 [Psychrobacter sp. C 20.9]|uniref:PLxRFG domain-containing protein n=1 Tax=Psychrobacter sp. C 20.9 TaxID=1926477 RepID=UPI0009471BE4|nr:PLxRFG domain-containing protein [Psychrobacter sp. C 20.9]OLF38015.1 hypothetical protein BTW00_02325 [Psychrobacter sp. C 20.9]